MDAAEIDEVPFRVYATQHRWEKFKVNETIKVFCWHSDAAGTLIFSTKPLPTPFIENKADSLEEQTPQASYHQLRKNAKKLAKKMRRERIVILDEGDDVFDKRHLESIGSPASRPSISSILGDDFY